jgi:hypothetical protein
LRREQGGVEHFAADTQIDVVADKTLQKIPPVITANAQNAAIRNLANHSKTPYFTP